MKKIYTIMFFASLGLFGVSVFMLAVFGLNFGVDFKGGSVMEIEFKDFRPSTDELTKSLLTDFPSLEFNVNPVGDKGFIIRSGDISEDEHQKILSNVGSFSGAGSFEEKRFDSIGPAIGAELRRKSFIAIGIMLAVIAAYITFVFRKLSRTLSLLGMNISTLVALLHDIVIPMGVFSFLGYYHNVQINAVFVAAVLTILGYTVSDKVVIFDRIRENMLKGFKGNLDEVVHKSVMQTLVRSINNTLTVVLSSAAIYFFGGESIRYFALALIIGIFLGAYSSIFVASPLLVWISAWRKSSSRG